MNLELVSYFVFSPAVINLIPSGHWVCSKTVGDGG